MPLEATPFDATVYIKTPERQAEYLFAALEDGDPSVIALVLGDIARACGASAFAKETGLSRETIYKTLFAGGNRTLETVSKAAKALGFRLTLAPVGQPEKAACPKWRRDALVGRTAQANPQRDLRVNPAHSMRPPIKPVISQYLASSPMAPRSPEQSARISRSPAAIVSTSASTTAPAPTRSMSRQMVTLSPICAGSLSAIASATTDPNNGPRTCIVLSRNRF